MAEPKKIWALSARMAASWPGATPTSAPRLGQFWERSTVESLGLSGPRVPRPYDLSSFGVQADIWVAGVSSFVLFPQEKKAKAKKKPMVVAPLRSFGVQAPDI